MTLLLAKSSLCVRWSHRRLQLCASYLQNDDQLNKDVSKNLQPQALAHLEKEKLVMKVIHLQRKLNSYQEMFHPKFFDGRDKVRVEMPRVDEIVRERTSLRKIALKFVYTGWNYLSYSLDSTYRINNAATLNSVERVFLEALMRQQLITSLVKHHNMERAGRTDRSVNSSAQVISVVVRSRLNKGYGLFGVPNQEAIADGGDNFAGRIDDRSLDVGEINYIKLMNEALPNDIRVIAWSPVRRRFSARFDCKMRKYKYHFRQGMFDLDIMQEAANKFIGDHDFRNFCKKSDENVKKHMTRTMQQFDIKLVEANKNNPELNLCVAEIKSGGFLHNQIRKMMSILFGVGSRNLPMSIVDEMLDVESLVKTPTYKSVVPEKLCLVGADYDDIDVCWRYDEEELAKSIRVLTHRYDKYATRCDILREQYDTMVEVNEERLRACAMEGISTSVVEDNEFDNDWVRYDDATKTLQQTQEYFKNKQIRDRMKKGSYQFVAEHHSQDSS